MPPSSRLLSRSSRIEVTSTTSHFASNSTRRTIVDSLLIVHHKRLIKRKRYGTVRYASLSLRDPFVSITLLSLHSNSNHVQDLRRLQGRSIAGSPAPVLRCMPFRLVLFQGLSEERLEEAAQANLQASQRGSRRHAGAE
jgi:hypothetical protein